MKQGFSFFKRSFGAFVFLFCLFYHYYLQVSVVTHMVQTSRSMRCFVKGATNNPLVQSSGCSEDKNDPGDGGGIPVFAFWSISCFGSLN